MLFFRNLGLATKMMVHLAIPLLKVLVPNMLLVTRLANLLMLLEATFALNLNLKVSPLATTPAHPGAADGASDVHQFIIHEKTN